MRVLLTGPLGTVGLHTLHALVGQGHTVRLFVRPTAANRRKVRRLRLPRGAWEVAWGDLGSQREVEAAVAGQEGVIHLAAMIPPRSEAWPERAREVNVEGTRRLLAAMAGAAVSPRLVYASSLAVFGYTQERPPPRTVEEPAQPTDHYTQHKVECEALVRASGLPWTILRLGAVVPVALAGKDPRLLFRQMFELPLDSRTECVHARDCGLALAGALTHPDVWGKTLLIGGGPRCQIDQRRFLAMPLAAMGIGMFPDEAFAGAPFALDWADTTESEALLAYQRTSFDAYARELRAAWRLRRPVLRLLRPLIRPLLLTQSRAYRGRR